MDDIKHGMPIKEARHRSSHITRFYLYEVSRIGKFTQDRRQMGGGRELEEGYREHVIGMGFVLRVMKLFWN